VSEGDEATRRGEAALRQLQHEVRTPIGQIMGYAEILEEELEDRDAEDLVPDLQKIREAARRLLDLADGRLREDMESDPLLGQADETAADDAAGPAETPAVDGDPIARVLVGDESADDRELLVRRLEAEGFTVELARDGLDVLRNIDARMPDLVLLEVLMPGMNGLEVLERIRLDHSRSELPVILATNLDETEDAVEGLARGANDYVTKPFDLPVLVARIRSQLETHRHMRHVAGLKRKLEFRSTFIREALGRDVSSDALFAVSERPDAVDLGGEARRVSAVVADIRGSQLRARELPPREQTTLLKNVFDALSEIVGEYGGVVDSVSGDSIVALFGLPLAAEDDAERAVACGIAWQLAMHDVNARNASAGLPEVEIGVGATTGDVVVLGLGSGEAIKYKAVGEPLVRAEWIEHAGETGEVWIGAETRALLGSRVRTDRTRTLEGEGFELGAEAHRVLGVTGNRLISLRSVPDDPERQGDRT